MTTTETSAPTPPDQAVDENVAPPSIDDIGRTGEPGKRAEIGKPFVDPVAAAILVGVMVGAVVWLGVNSLVVIGAVLVMIFFHELGHFVMARRSGMMVTEFFIGIGPRIASFRRGDVEYGLKAVPVAAYVKIIGMANVESVPPEIESRTYRQKGFGARFGVAVAGSAMHFTMALILLFISFAFLGDRYAGVIDDTLWEVDKPSPGSAAEAAGIRPGDRVIGIDGVKVSTFSEMGTEARRHAGETVDVDVLRDGNVTTVAATLNSRLNIVGTVGEDISLITDNQAVTLAAVSPIGRLGEAGFEAGDQVESINGFPVGGMSDVVDIIDMADDGVLAIDVRRSDSTYSGSVDLGTEVDTSPAVGFLGVGPNYPTVTSGLAESATASVSQFVNLSGQTLGGLGRVLQPASLLKMVDRTVNVSPTDSNQSDTATAASDVSKQREEADSDRIVSIVGAVRLGTSFSETDWGVLVLLFIHLNIVIGFFNLVPLPPFDGGHVMVAVYERIRELIRGDGRRYFVDYNRIMPIAYGVVITLGLVSLMAIFLDVVDPIPV